MNEIKVVDLFAGPGGLGEGFARFSPDESPESRPFRIVFSAEKDPAAVRTLRLRTFFRLCEARGPVPESYYQYVRGDVEHPFDSSSEDLWKHACQEAATTELGTEAGDSALRAALKRNLNKGDEWILIGGPPCQAYSLVGRSRNRGIADYAAEKDQRNFLYEHYLDILANHQPAAFVMENVKGILSSRVGNEQMFPRILRDLANPGRAAGRGARPRYTIHALTSPTVFEDGDDFTDIDPRNFLIRAEEYGIPQARHRVILIGIRRGSGLVAPDPLQPVLHRLDASVALRSIPPLRSGITRRNVTTSEWRAEILQALKVAASNGLEKGVVRRMQAAFDMDMHTQLNLTQGGRFVPTSRIRIGRSNPEKAFLSQVVNKQCAGYLNHQARNHMPMDLLRYLYASTMAMQDGVSPKAGDYPSALAPYHDNWKSGKFADRFRVQVPDRPSTTITSHISKDGHYFIHPESWQCRSLTVREAARLQTFPDDYFFEGPRTSQFVQVGNAVPPLLAKQLAEQIYTTLMACGRDNRECHPRIF